MTQRKDNATTADWREILGSGPDGLRQLVQQVVQEVLEAEMDETVGAQKGERTGERLGYRSGYYTRTLVTRVGKLVLRVPQDRQGRFRTELFGRYQRSEKALVCALTEMYIQGVSTRKVKEITESPAAKAAAKSASTPKTQPNTFRCVSMSIKQFVQTLSRRFPTCARLRVCWLLSARNGTATNLTMFLWRWALASTGSGR